MNEDDVFSMAVRLMMFGEDATEEMASSCLHQAKAGKNQFGKFYLGFAKSAVAHIDHLPSRTAKAGASTVPGYPSKWEIAWKACLHAQTNAQDGDRAGFASPTYAVGSEGRGSRQNAKNPPCFMYGEMAGWNS